jgi:hypothetical protein
VLVDGVNVPTGTTVDMGITPTNVTVSKVITITNWGAASLHVSNLTMYSNPPFSISPATLQPILSLGSTNLTISFNSTNTGLFSGTLEFWDDDMENPEDTWPFVINFVARANPAGVPPRIVITAPTEGQLFTVPTNVAISAVGIATNTTTVTQMMFYAVKSGVSTFIGSANTNNGGITWGNASSGNFTLRAVPIDGQGRFGLPTNVNVSFNNRPVLRTDFVGVSVASGSNYVDVLFNDRDPDGDSLTVTNITATNCTHGIAGRIGSTVYYIPTNSSGRDSFWYTVSDGRGGTATTNVSVIILPGWLPDVFDQTAVITYPTNDTLISSPIDVTGSALSPYLQFYQLQYRRHTAYAPWKTFAEGDTEVTNSTLGTFDPTGLPNGAYEIRLRVTDWVDGATTENYPPVIIQIGEGMKIGHFTVSFNDLQIPVSGLPITLTRTYDSRNTKSGEFGVGWHLDIRSARLQKAGVLGSGWGLSSYGFGGLYSCFTPTEPHLVTIVFPNDQKFQFDAQLELNDTGQPCTQAYGVSGAYARMVFRPLQGTTGTLVPLHDPSTLDINIFDGSSVTLHEDRGNVSILGPIYDPPEFVFTTLDGRQFQFNAEGKVAKMTDRMGNTIH